MAINRRLQGAITGLRFHNNSRRGSTLQSSYDDSNMFNLLESVDISGDSFEIPINVKRIVETTLMTNEARVSKFVLPFCIGSVSTKRTADSVISTLFSSSNGIEMLQSFRLKDDVYYGNPGLILDSEFKPIVYCCYSYGGTPIECKEFRAYIHPTVFQNPTKIMHKAIISRVIPAILDIPSWEPIITVFLRSPKIKSTLIIKDRSDIIVTPSIPSGIDVDRDINQMLNDKVEEVLYQLKI